MRMFGLAVAALILAATVSAGKVGNALADEVTTTSYTAPTPVNQDVEWMGFAISTNGRVFQRGGYASEFVARDEARRECENSTARRCSAISVPSTWDVLAIECRGHGAMSGFLGGSSQNGQDWIAYEHARDAGFDDDDCQQMYRY